MDNSMDNSKKCCEAFHKHIFKIPIVLLLLVLIVFVGAKAKNEIKNETKIAEYQRTITVSADGKVFAKPDIGQISLGVRNEAKTVSEAQKQSTEAINKIVNFLKAAGVEEKDVKTTNYNISPRYDYIEGKQILRGYEVSQNLQIKIRDLTKSGDIIAGAAENGANVIGELSFTIDEPDVLKAEARKQAIEKAKEKAENLADDLGIKLGKLINFNESSSGVPRVYYDYAEALGKGATAPSPEIPTGENEITSTVSLTYEIK